jgi:DNA polymerase-3 subunit epsilon
LLSSLPPVSAISRQWRMRQLRDSKFAFLLDPPPPHEWVAIDCETTGLNVRSDEIVSIGAVRIEGSRILTSERLELLVRPEHAMPEQSVRLHQLRERDVAQGLSLAAAITKLLYFIGSRPLVGYYLKFDVAMLNRTVQPMLGWPLLHEQIDVSAMYYGHKFRQLAPYQQNDSADIDLHFATMMRDLDLPVFESHNALDEAVMAAMAFVKLHGAIKKPGT